MRQTLYRIVEIVLGRDLTWRVGRFLYMGARRELGNDATTNGEYDLIHWVLEAVASRRNPAAQVDFALIDVGANLGDWTERAYVQSRRLGLLHSVHIHAFEPAPEQNARLTARMCKAIASGHLSVHREAVGAAKGLASFTIAGPIAGTGALSNGASIDGQQIQVEVLTLDDAATRGRIADIALVKVDTEGNDFNVIRGGLALLRQGRIMVLQFEYNWRWVGFGHCLKHVFAEIEGSPYRFGRLTQGLIEVHAEWHPEIERYFETNYVLVRRDILPLLPHHLVAFGPSGTIVPAMATS